MIQVEESRVLEIASNLGLFSRLHILSLPSLPMLRSICGWSLLFPSLKSMDMRRCPKLRKMPLDSNFKVSENLEEIIGEQ